MNVKAVKTRIFREGEDLVDFVVRHIPKLTDGSILVVASKIVSLSEQRTAPLKEKSKLIKDESEVEIRTKYVSLTMRQGVILPNAGIDESNASGKLILLPKDSFKSAFVLREKLKKHFKIKKLGVIIVDSWVTPMRAGVTGLALGYAGFRGVKSYKGKKDLFGRRFRFSSVNVADSLATSAAVVMGEGNERQPLAIVSEMPVEFSEKISKRELEVSPQDDMFSPLLKSLRIRRT